jgi:hypothetical protein
MEEIRLFACESFKNSKSAWKNRPIRKASANKKRKRSAEGRARIVAALKKRWAKAKKK